MRDHSPVQKEPEYGFHVVVELMLPPVVLGLILQFEWINEFFDFLLNVVDSLRVGVGIAFRTFWYLGNIVEEGAVWNNEWHWFSLLNSS